MDVDLRSGYEPSPGSDENVTLANPSNSRTSSDGHSRQRRATTNRLTGRSKHVATSRLGLSADGRERRIETPRASQSLSGRGCGRRTGGGHHGFGPTQCNHSRRGMVCPSTTISTHLWIVSAVAIACLWYLGTPAPHSILSDVTVATHSHIFT